MTGKEDDLGIGPVGSLRKTRTIQLGEEKVDELLNNNLQGLLKDQLLPISTRSSKEKIAAVRI